MISQETYEKAINRAFEISLFKWDSKDQARKFHSVEIDKWRKLFNLAGKKGVRRINTSFGGVSITQNGFIGIADVSCDFNRIKRSLVY